LAFFNSRITAWRTNAPAAHLTSSPTFDGAADKSVEYAFFKPIDSQLDSRSTVFWAPSNDPACTWRVLAGETANTSYTDGRTEDDAEQVSGYLSSALNFENQYWGLADKKFLTTVCIFLAANIVRTLLLQNVAGDQLAELRLFKT
jgi:hypothetical protein